MPKTGKSMSLESLHFHITAHSSNKDTNYSRQSTNGSWDDNLAASVQFNTYQLPVNTCQNIRVCFGALSTPSLVSSMLPNIPHVWQNAVEELGHCNTHYLNCTPFRITKIKISFTKYVPRSYNIFCTQVNRIQFRQWILKWPNCLTVFLPSTCITSVSKYGMMNMMLVYWNTLYSLCMYVLNGDWIL
jgi:hypothetical protein